MSSPRRRLTERSLWGSDWQDEVGQAVDALQGVLIYHECGYSCYCIRTSNNSVSYVPMHGP